MDVRRLAWAWKRHGPVRFAYLVLYNLWEGLLRSVGHGRNAGPSDLDFDEKYGVDTARTLEIGQLRVDAAAARHAHRYQATSVGTILEVLGSLPIDPGQFNFVDFGSGKGRVLLVASAFPFRTIIGVEFSPELHAICEANIRVYRGEDQRCFDLRPVCQDAVAFEPPDGPLVCYFYSPFDRALMARVAANMADKAGRDGQPVIVAYVEPEYADVFAPDRWDVVRQGDGHVIFHSR